MQLKSRYCFTLNAILFVRQLKWNKNGITIYIIKHGTKFSNNMFSLTLVSFLLCLSIVIILWQRRRFYYASFKMRGPYALPLLGNIEIARGNKDSNQFLKWFSKCFSDILQKFLDFRKKYGSTFRLWLGTTLTVCITKPEDFVIILNSSNALRKADPYDLITPILGQGIFHCRDGECFNMSNLVLFGFFVKFQDGVQIENW